MPDCFTGSWAERYEALVEPKTGPIGTMALSQAGLYLCGMNICVDARVDMHNMRPLLDAPADTPAGKLGTMLVGRAARGIGGEVRVEWPDGPQWLRDHLDIRYALGGTGPQAGRVLSRLGVAALVAVEDRHSHQLKYIPDGVLLAEGETLKSACDVSLSGPHIPEVFIFEFTAGKPIGATLPTRSSRIIVRFCDRGVQHDTHFEDMSVRLAATAAAGIVSGLNDEPPENVASAGKYIFSLSRKWMERGLSVVHFELAGYSTQEAVNEALHQAKGAITSLGMSHSELLAMDPAAEEPMEAMIELGERLGIERVCVHADTWAAAVTRNDPNEEELALMAGCAIASSRAGTGEPAEVIRTHPSAEFHPLPFENRVRRGKWTFVACAAPYVEKPVTTLGLGDSFTAGCLLVLGKPAHATIEPAVKRA